MKDVIIKRVEYIEAQERRYGSSSWWRFRNCNHDRYADGTEVDDEEPLIEEEVVHPDIPTDLPGVELDREQTVSEIQEADNDNPEAVEADAARALANTDISFPPPN